MWKPQHRKSGRLSEQAGEQILQADRLENRNNKIETNMKENSFTCICHYGDDSTPEKEQVHIVPEVWEE